MKQLKIQDLQMQLNNMIDRGADTAKIYELSIRLDALIVEYYNKKLGK